jgi:hypothetical protein
MRRFALLEGDRGTLIENFTLTEAFEALPEPEFVPVPLPPDGIAGVSRDPPVDDSPEHATVAVSATMPR